MAIGSSDAQTDVLAVGVNSDGSIFVANSGQSMTATSASGVFTFGNRHEVEIAVSAFSAGGVVTIDLDGVAVAGLTAVSVGTLAALNDGSTIHSVAMGGTPYNSASTTTIVMDSTYAMDTTGSYCNAAVGPAISVPKIPNGVGQESADA